MSGNECGTRQTNAVRELLRPSNLLGGRDAYLRLVVEQPVMFKHNSSTTGRKYASLPFPPIKAPFYLPRRHRRKLLFPPGLLAMAGLLWLGRVAVGTWQG